MVQPSSGTRLSASQRAFAERLKCSPQVVQVGQAVCFYRVLGPQTIRWIVDRNGEVLDQTVFHAGA